MTPITAEEVRRFVLDRFATVIAERGLAADSLADDFDLLSTGVVDSLGVIELISAVEERFQTTVDFANMDPVDLTVLGPFSKFVAQNASRNATTKSPDRS